MMKSDLPPDLIVEILYRVPSNSLKRLRSTCKGWNALFQDQRFSEVHFRKAPKESLHLMLNEHRLCSIRVDLNVVPLGPSIEFKRGFDLEDPYSNSEEVDIAQVFHCDGLLLCKTMDERLVVWNPCTGETRWIKPGNEYNRTECSMLFSLGYKNEKSYRNYKILRRNGKARNGGSEIYDFSTNSWRVIEDMDISCLIIGFGVSLKGNIYWTAFDFDKQYDVVVCFDFTTERSKRLSLPLSHEHSFFRALSVVREEQLSVLSINDDSSKVEMWMTTNNNFDTEEDLSSWSRFIAVDLLPRVQSVIVIAGFIIDEEKKVGLTCMKYHGTINRNLACIVGGDYSYCKEMPFKIEEYQWPPCTLYVPSLLQIQQKRE